jgi:hypothetical protein
MSNGPTWLQTGVLGWFNNIMPVTLYYPEEQYQHLWNHYMDTLRISMALVLLALLIFLTVREIRAFVGSQNSFSIEIGSPFDYVDQYIHSPWINLFMLIYNQFMILITCTTITIALGLVVLVFFGSLYKFGFLAAFLWSFVVWPIGIAHVIKYRWQMHARECRRNPYKQGRGLQTRQRRG